MAITLDWTAEQVGQDGQGGQDGGKRPLTIHTPAPLAPITISRLLYLAQHTVLKMINAEQ